MRTIRMSAPIIEVGYDELTYRELEKQSRKDMIHFSPSRPQTIEQRIAKDTFGCLLVYAGTLVICDLMRTMAFGEWTRLASMFLGPWNAHTGMPVYHWIVRKVAGTAVKKCNSNYDANILACGANVHTPLSWIGHESMGDAAEELDDCINKAHDDQVTCIEKTPEYAACQQRITEAYDDYRHPQAPPGDIPELPQSPYNWWDQNMGMFPNPFPGTGFPSELNPENVQSACLSGLMAQ